RRRQRQAPCIQCCEGNFQTFALASYEILARDADILEFHHRIVERAQSHEMTAVQNLQFRSMDVDNEGRDLFALATIHHFRWSPGHDDKDASLDAVGAPEFFAI